ncbi:MAG: type IV pilus twitching motility protein PilT [Vicinamibacterales bacterium]
MPLVDSLLTAIVRSDGDALVLHVGEKPYVVAAAGPVELSRQGLGLGAMEGLLAQLLSAEALRGLREMGAVEHELASIPAAGADRFTVVAARGGDDIWIEVRRHRRVRPPAPVAEPVATVEAAIAAAAEPPSVPAHLPPPAVAEPAAATPDEAMPDEARPDEAMPDEATPEEAMHDAAMHDDAIYDETMLDDAPLPPPPADVLAAGADEPLPSDTDIAAAPGPADATAAAAVSEPSPADEALPAAEPPVPEPVALDAAVPEAEAWRIDVPAAFDTGDRGLETFADEIRFAEDEVLAVEAEVAESDSGAPEAWTFDHVPAIDFEQAAAQPQEVGVDVPARTPDSFDAAPEGASAAPPPEAPPIEDTAPEPMPEAVMEAVPPEPAAAESDVPVPPAEPEPVAVPEFAPPPAAPTIPAAEVPASATMSTVPLSPELPPAPEAPPVDLHAPRYDAPAAAVSPRAPMPRVDSTVPEPPPYRPTEPQPTLPGLPPMAFDDVSPGETPVEGVPGVVLSLTRDSARAASQAARAHGRTGGIERLLRLAAARGASALYLTTQARPAVRVDGDIRLLEGESPLSSGDVEAAVLELAPEGARDKESAEWIRDLQDVGRVRITTFRDYRGPGALLRMISARATSAEQLGLVREIQALAMEPEGLVIVSGPRASGKSTLVSAFVDLINRQRNDYVITLEGQIRLVHESRGSLISQRELRGSAGEIVAAARAALRENPDVLIIEDLRSPDVLQVALDAAGSGLLVFASVTAASATAALERLVDLCPSEQRRTVRAALAEHLRGVVAQVLLRKAGGGRLAARELVLNTNAVAALVSDGQIAQLPRAIDSGRKLGMAPLNDALVAFVQSGAVDVREAYRKADDKSGLLGLLRREGIDTSFVERLA